MAGLELLEIVGPALIAGLLITLVHAPLGLEVLRRGIIFIDLAIAQSAGLGVVIVGLATPVPRPWMVQAGALTCALLAGLLFRTVEKHLRDEQEAIIGCTFVVTATLALLVLADNPHGGEAIQRLLSGQILFVRWRDVLAHAPVFVVGMWAWFRFPRVRDGGLFYVAFALVVTSSVQLAGVYVVFASLILPALAAVGLAFGQVKVAWGCGIASVAFGIGSSLAFDLPSGPMMVIGYTGVTVVVRVLRRLARTA